MYYYHIPVYFFFSQISSTIVLALVLIIISCFVLSSIDFLVLSFTCFFHLDLLMFSTFFIFSPISPTSTEFHWDTLFMWLGLTLIRTMSWNLPLISGVTDIVLLLKVVDYRTNWAIFKSPTTKNLKNLPQKAYISGNGTF